MASEFKFQKLGRIFNVELDKQLPEWMTTHAQVPVPYFIDEKLLRILFSTRDNANTSRVGYVDVNMDEPQKVIGLSSRPMLDKGTMGAFDDCGVMPSCVVSHDGLNRLYYVGWNVRNTVPYHNTVGVAQWNQADSIYTRLYNGPLLERTHLEPFFSGTSCVLKDNGIWKCWYMSCTGWDEMEGVAEPRYHIKYAESIDGIVWNREGRVAIDYKSDDEGGISKASVIKLNETYLMWYSYRQKSEYRTDRDKSYRIGFASSIDGLTWIRKDDLAGISCSESGWDSEMLCYPHVFAYEGRLYMLYNGNGFGVSGFGIAVADLI